MRTTLHRMPCHGVQCASVFEPADLALVERVVQFCLPGLTIFGVYFQSQRFANGQFCTHDVDLVVGVDFVVIGGISEGEW